MSQSEIEDLDLSTERPEVALKRWQDCVRTLVAEVKGWVEEAGWRTRVIEKPIDDRKLGRHLVDVLLMERDTIEVALNPVSAFAPGAMGAVDLYLVPAYDDIATLYFEAGEWVIYYDFPLSRNETLSMSKVERYPLRAEVILKILDSISSRNA